MLLNGVKLKWHGMPQFIMEENIPSSPSPLKSDISLAVSHLVFNEEVCGIILNTVI